MYNTTYLSIQLVSAHILAYLLAQLAKSGRSWWEVKTWCAGCDLLTEKFIEFYQTSKFCGFLDAGGAVETPCCGCGALARPARPAPRSRASRIAEQRGLDEAMHISARVGFLVV